MDDGGKRSGYFMVPNSLVAPGGPLQQLTKGELAVYLVMREKANPGTVLEAGAAFLGERAGITEPANSRRALRGLVAKGLVRVESQGGGRHNRSTYRLLDPAAAHADAPAAGELFANGVNGAPVPMQNGVTHDTVSGEETVSIAHENGVNGARKRCQPRHPHQELLIKNSSSRTEARAAHAPAAAAVPPAFPIFPTVRGKKSEAAAWTLPHELVTAMQDAFPAVDVPGECRRAHQWACTNPTRRKTAGGMPDFLRRWMAKEQNNPRPKNSGYGGGRAERKTPAQRGEYCRPMPARVREL